MILKAIAFTERGQAWSGVLGVPVVRGVPAAEWARANFGSADALLFIGACGIAVRTIAPLIKDKTTDPAVLVMDEAGEHVIPILSGHIGGANALAERIAALTGAKAVLTTATDVRGVPAIDTWALENDCAIENPPAIRDVSAAALAGRQVGVAITEREIKPPFPVTLFLRPRTLTLGAGCKRGTDPDAFETNALAFLKSCGVSPLSLRALASIDRKAEEAAMCGFAEKYRLPFLTYSAQSLQSLPGRFAHSGFAEQTVGVDNVCERSAVAGGGVLLMGKTVFPGMTFALAGEAET